MKSEIRRKNSLLVKCRSFVNCLTPKVNDRDSRLCSYIASYVSYIKVPNHNSQQRKTLDLQCWDFARFVGKNMTEDILKTSVAKEAFCTCSVNLPYRHHLQIPVAPLWSSVGALVISPSACPPLAISAFQMKSINGKNTKKHYEVSDWNLEPQSSCCVGIKN